MTRSRGIHLYSRRIEALRAATVLLFVLTLLSLILPDKAWSHNRIGEPIPTNCILRIDLFNHQGIKTRHQFKTHLESPSECAMLARMHQPNFEPGRVSKKKVVYRWVK